MKEKQSYNVKLSFRLSEEDLEAINNLLTNGKTSARTFKRALVLKHFHEGKTSPVIASYVDVTAETARRIGWNYVNEGIKRALYDLPIKGAEKKLTEKQQTHIVALVCSDPPEGYCRWTIRLLTEEVVNRKIVDSIGRETIRILLKSHGIKPWREKKCGAYQT
jgi:transposase